MKHAITLSNDAFNTLLVLEKKFHASKTAIIEKALRFYAQKKLSDKNSLLEYAGILDEKEASSMLTIIEGNKHNKEIKNPLIFLQSKKLF